MSYRLEFRFPEEMADWETVCETENAGEFYAALSQAKRASREMKAMGHPAPEVRGYSGDALIVERDG